MDREKRELVEEIERLQQRSTRITREYRVVWWADVISHANVAEELHSLRTHRTEASQKIAHLDVEVSELKMAAETAKVGWE